VDLGSWELDEEVFRCQSPAIPLPHFLLFTRQSVLLLFLVASSISMLNFPMFPVPTEQPGHGDDSGFGMRWGKPRKLQTIAIIERGRYQNGWVSWHEDGVRNCCEKINLKILLISVVLESTMKITHVFYSLFKNHNQKSYIF